MKQFAAAFFAGLVFGLGLIVSEMVNPHRVLGFLDVAGRWDPTLAFVMLGALLVTTIGYRLIFTRNKPFFESAFSLPTTTLIDRNLILGAAVFGLGWGLSGICPGPAIVAGTTLSTNILAFIAAMLVGMKGFDFIRAH